jgi:putative FmdB family regulatory protein
MPTYSYACDACRRGFEIEQRISDEPIKKCPHCGKLKARRMISSGNFILKGGGWYSDGYGSSKSPTRKQDKDSSSGAASSTSTAKTSDSNAAKPGKPASTGTE